MAWTKSGRGEIPLAVMRWPEKQSCERPTEDQLLEDACIVPEANMRSEDFEDFSGERH